MQPPGLVVSRESARICLSVTGIFPILTTLVNSSLVLGTKVALFIGALSSLRACGGILSLGSYVGLGKVGGVVVAWVVGVGTYFGIDGGGSDGELRGVVEV